MKRTSNEYGIIPSRLYPTCRVMEFLDCGRKKVKMLMETGQLRHGFKRRGTKMLVPVVKGCDILRYLTECDNIEMI